MYTTKYILGHTKLILWMTDSQQKKMERASDFFFLNFFLFSQKMVRAKKRQFFFKKLISRKNGASGKEYFFQRKKRNIDVIFRWEKKLVSPDKKWSGEIIKKKIDAPKKMERRVCFFLIKKNYITVKSKRRIRHPYN